MSIVDFKGTYPYDEFGFASMRLRNIACSPPSLDLGCVTLYIAETGSLLLVYFRF
jgi:hypothetical protein